MRLEEAGITKEVCPIRTSDNRCIESKLIGILFGFQVMNSAIAQFCLEVIARHGDPAPRLCNKDPLTLKLGSYVLELFPNVSADLF